jgi:hypothetical protein
MSPLQAGRLLLVTNNLKRYQANTQMEDVINWLKDQPGVLELNVRRLYLDGQPVLKAVLEAIELHRADVVLFVDGPPLLELSLDELVEIRRLVYVAMFFGDIFAHFDSTYKYYTQVIDCGLVDETVEVGRFKLYGTDALFVPYAYLPGVPDAEEAQKTIPVSFIGRTDRFGRMEYIQAANKTFHISLYGVGTPNGPVNKEQMIRIFKTSQINLNFTGVQLDQPYRHARPIDLRVRSAKGRCQEISQHGGFVLSENAPDLALLFKPGVEIDVFDSRKELIDKIEYYLTHPEVTREMALRARKRAHENYRVDAVWSQVVNELMAKARERSGRLPRPDLSPIADEELELTISREMVTIAKSLVRNHELAKLASYVRREGTTKIVRRAALWARGRRWGY